MTLCPLMIATDDKGINYDLMNMLSPHMEIIDLPLGKSCNS
jgi:hypothetical protein